MAANTISTGLEKLQETLNGSAEGKKVAQIAQSSVNYHDESNRLTTDAGVKVHDTDNWLRVSNEDKIGPALLEDNMAREKVCEVLPPLSSPPLPDLLYKTLP